MHALAADSAIAQQARGLSAVWLPNVANGYPRWYQDWRGLRLEPCLDTTPDDPCGVIAGGLPNPEEPVVFPTNFPDEFFYMRDRPDRWNWWWRLPSRSGDGPPGRFRRAHADGGGRHRRPGRVRSPPPQGHRGLVPGATYT